MMSDILLDIIWFNAVLKELNVTLPKKLCEQLVIYLNILQEWNKIHNLTGVRDPKIVVPRHFLDSLTLSPYLHGTEWIDIGSGAGFPGLVLACAYPDKKVTLLDSQLKKIKFLTCVVDSLRLSNVSIVRERAEHFHPARGFDSILSRALGSLDKMLRQTHHLLNPGGRFLAMKGRYPTDELAQVPDGYRYTVYALENSQAERHIVCLEKKAR